MRRTVGNTAIAATVLTFAIATISGVGFVVLHRADAPTTDPALLAAEARAARADSDRALILSLIATHRRGASGEWCAELAEAIHRESVLAGIDPLMVVAIVAKESSFKPRVVSRAGAVGLMQLRPFVARDVARRGRVEWQGVETLHSPDLNVRLGILYYKELVERFDGDRQVALTAYNQGPTRVSRQLARGTYAGSAYAAGVLEMYESIRNRPGASRT